MSIGHKKSLLDALILAFFIFFGKLGDCVYKLLAIIISAIKTKLVGQFGFLAFRAQAQLASRKSVMRAPIAPMGSSMPHVIDHAVNLNLSTADLQSSKTKLHRHTRNLADRLK